MLHRIEVYVIKVPLHIDIIANPMLDKTPLPDRAVAAPDARGTLLHAVQRPAGMRHPMLDLRPALREIRVVNRQSPDAMQVIRHQYPSVDEEWLELAYGFDCVAKSFTDWWIAEDGATAVGHDREEE
jgi:hypothetical protein